MQICIRCNKEKILTDFHRSKRYTSGHNIVCAECDNIKRKQAYHEGGQKEVSKRYRDSKSLENIEYQKQYREENKQALLEKRIQNIERKKQLDRVYTQANPAKVVAKAAKRRALRLKATPSWASKAYIDIFYQMAKDEQVRTGRLVEVDHIAPLNSELVCGLHSEDNLQLLFKEDNASKSNVTWPDMW